MDLEDKSFIFNQTYIAGIELYEKDTHLITLKSGDKLIKIDYKFIPPSFISGIFQ